MDSNNDNSLTKSKSLLLASWISLEVIGSTKLKIKLEDFPIPISHMPHILADTRKREEGDNINRSQEKEPWIGQYCFS